MNFFCSSAFSRRNRGSFSRGFDLLVAEAALRQELENAGHWAGKGDAILVHRAWPGDSQKLHEKAMKNRLVVILVGWAIGVAVPTFAQQKDTVDPKIAQEINALGKLAEAINKNDPVAVAAVFTEDAVCVTPQGPIYGREAIKEHYADVFKQFQLSNDVPKADQNSPHKIGTAGNEVWETGEWSCNFRDSDGGRTTQNRGYYSAVYIRDGDTWKLGRSVCRSSTSPHHRLLRILRQEVGCFSEEVAETIALLTYSFFGDILRSLLPRVSPAKPTSAPVQF
jgi:ketosteroid isomerase-like protein